MPLRRRIAGSPVLILMAGALGAGGCNGNLGRAHTGPPTLPTLQSARTLRYAVLVPVEVAAPRELAVPSGLPAELRQWVQSYMKQVELPLVDDPKQAHDAEVHLSLVVRGISLLTHGSAAMEVMGRGQVVDQWSTNEHFEPSGGFARAVARDLVEGLVHSTRVAAYADAAAGGGGKRPGGAPAPEVAAPAADRAPGPPEASTPALPPPPPASADNIAAARGHSRQGAAYYDLNRFREAYAEFEQAYVLEQDAALLYNMGQCQRKLGNTVEALHFYRTYLRRAPNGPSSVEAAHRVRELEDAAARGKN